MFHVEHLVAKAHFFFDDAQVSACGHRSRVDTEEFEPDDNEDDLCALCKKALVKAWEV